MNIVNFTVNGVVRQAEASPDMVLLDYLRGTLQLTGAKQSCDKKGQCGACTVIVDEKAVKSCLRKVVDLEGSSVLTVEGLGTPDNPHLIQEAFVLSGAIQCGFCTPGMIMAVKALLDNNPNPTLPEIKRALARNLCRCTGYIKIIDAIKLAGKLMRHETTPDQIRAGYTKKGIIGVPHPRPSAMLKACGAAEFTADVKVKGAAEIAVVHSTEHHAIIKSIDSSYALKMPGVIGIMTAADIKGTNRIRVVIPDQPVLCEDRVRLLGDPIAIIAAETRDQARAAAAAVKVEYERLPAMMTPQEALAPGAKQIHNQWPNLYISQPLLRGDTEKAFTESAAVVEADFTTQINHQAPMEPEASVAYLDGDGEDAQLVITGRSINIHGHKSQLAESLGCKNVRYKEAFAGGQFGIKLAITTEALAGAAALHFKRPFLSAPSLTFI